MWIRWRAEQIVMKQEVYTELWMEDLMRRQHLEKLYEWRIATELT
jgi:hypothetical protein